MSKLPERFATLSPQKLALVAQNQALNRAIINADPIAIVGIGCRFPQDTDTPERFWQLLRNGLDAVTEVPASRWDTDDFYNPDPDAPGKIYTRYGSFLTQIDNFDPAFFGISPREARMMDPQQRLLLEVSWESLEHAGIDPSSLRGSQTGVFIGMMAHDYSYLSTETFEQIDAYTATGSMMSVAAGRLAYFLGSQGPTFTVDTTCSSSLVSLHLACQSLRTGECDLALAGGVQLMVSPHLTIMEARLHMFSVDGRCKAFDQAADGMGRGEGCGVLVLKRLADAITGGDRILALIRGSAVSHDGRSSGLTVPNGVAQQRVMQQALASCGVSAEQVSYVETHGTGTPVGDLIEVGALESVYGRNREVPLFIGSVKTNIGHTEGAAGVAGVIKVILALQHAEIPPNLHFHQPNPQVPWEEYHIAVPTQHQPWPTGDRRLAGVSSFGMSGTNAHLVLEATPAELLAGSVQPEGDRPVHLLTLSATTARTLRELAQRYADHLAATSDLALADLCFTANTGRAQFDYRLSVVAGTQTELHEKLSTIAKGETPLTASVGQAIEANHKIAFLFTGQGAQYIDMGRELYATSPTFRATLDRCEELFQQETGASLLAVLYPGDSGALESGQSPLSNLLDDTTYTQPALFALEVALARLWQSWGIQPDMLLGHSIGELAAACVAGVFSLEEGLKLVAARGQLMGALPQDGVMVSLLADEARVRQTIAPYAQEVSIAAINGLTSTVIAGKRERVLAIADKFAAEGIKTRKLPVSHAFHSPLMEPMLADFAKVAKSITYHSPQIPLVSNITGKLSTDPLSTDPLSTDPLSTDAPATWQYWVRHVREAVRFGDGVNTLHEQGINIFLEIGPKPTLLGMVERETASQALPSLREEGGDWSQLLTSLGALYISGSTIQWDHFDRGGARHKVALPTYPFQRQRYWVDTPKKRHTAALRPLIDKMTQSPAIKETIFETEFSVARLPFLTDHRVYDKLVSPGACQLAMVLNAAGLAFGKEQALQAEDVVLPQALVIPKDGASTVQTIFTPVAANGRGAHCQFKVISFAPIAQLGMDQVATSTHVTGNITESNQELLVSPALDQLRERCDQPFNLAAYYADLDHAQFLLGSNFRWIRTLWQSTDAATACEFAGGESLAQLQLPETVAIIDDYLLHPGLLDACFQVAGMTRRKGEQPEILLPFALESLKLHQRARGSTWWCHAIQVAPYKWNLQLLAHNGALLATLTGFEMRPASVEALQRQESWREWLYTVRWEAQPLAQTAPDGTALPTVEGQRWLIFADRQGVGAALAAQLRHQGATPFLVYADVAAEASWRQVDATTYQLHPAQREQIEPLLLQLTAERTFDGVVHLWMLDTPLVAQASDLTTAAQVGCGTVLPLVQILLQQRVQPDGLWLVTQGAQAVTDVDAVAGVAQSTLWGIAKVMTLEHPEHPCVCIDIDRQGDIDGQGENEADISVAAKQLLTEIITPSTAPNREAQVALRDGQRYVARLVRYPQVAVRDALVLPDTPYQLTVQARGELGGLQLTKLDRRPPMADEVEIKVYATGLNFLDVLDVLGVLPFDREHLGGECAGEVIAVGDAVTEYRPGDRVVVVGGNSFGQYLTVATTQIATIPANLSFAAAATIPINFLTAYYALHCIAQIKPDDKVLIHAASGGTGMAAVRIAQAVGAEVYGTAHPAKWATLRAMGIKHIYNSRTLDFAAEILRDTAGVGVDIVLNSLTGEGFIEKSLSALAPHGKFIEIAKRDVWTAEAFHAVRSDVTYQLFDLLTELRTKPTAVRQVLEELMHQFQEGALGPVPYLSFPIEKAVSAFRYMQQAKHTGKIILTHPTTHDLRIRREASYLITGGLGALGLAAAKWLAEQGAGHLVLMGRSRPTSAAEAQLAELAQHGVTVTVVQADVANGAQVQEVIAQIDTKYPLRGIIHAAGLLDDGALLHQQWDRFPKVLAPKVEGTWHLHQASQTLPLDFFVLFSSITSLLGNRGQANYAAANAFLDAFVHYRRAQGLPALAINWGSWAEIGLAAALVAQTRPQMAARGEGSISPSQGIATFAGLLRESVAQVGVIPMTWARYFAHLPNIQPYYSAIRPVISIDATSPQADALPLHQQLAEADREERQALLLDHLRLTAARVLGLPDSTAIDPNKGLLQIGLDSLMAIDLRNQWSARLALKLPATLIFDYPTLAKIADFLLESLAFTPKEHPAAPTQSTDHTLTVSPPELTDLDQLSDDDLMAQIDAEFLRRQ